MAGGRDPIGVGWGVTPCLPSGASFFFFRLLSHLQVTGCGESESGEEGEDEEGEEREEGEVCDYATGESKEKGEDENLSGSEKEEDVEKERRVLESPEEQVAEEPAADSSDGASESAVSSAYTVATTTSYLHGDRTTVQQLVARGLKKKQQQVRRRIRHKKETKAVTGTKKDGAKNNGKTELKWSMDDSEW